MRIAYLIDWDLTKESGLISKVVSKLKQWINLGNEVHLIIVSYRTNKKAIPNFKNIHIVERKELNYLKIGAVKTYIGRNEAWGRVYNLLISLKPDIIYYRPNPIWYPNNSKCLKLAPSVVEINSLDDEEMKHRFGERSLKYNIFKFGRKSVLKNCSAIIAVTNEIALSLKKISYKPIKVFSNAYDFDNITNHKENRSDHNTRPQVLFIGSPGQDWQGFEKFVLLAHKIKDVDFHLVGPPINKWLEISNLIQHGYLNQKEVEQLYKKMDIGVGTLSLHIKYMEEACPLKVREYYAHGLPVILGYKDSDLAGKPFTLDIGNYAENVADHIQEIRDFIFINHIKFVPRNISEPLIGTIIKEKERMAFIKTLL